MTNHYDFWLEHIGRPKKAFYRRLLLLCDLSFYCMKLSRQNIFVLFSGMWDWDLRCASKLPCPKSNISKVHAIPSETVTDPCKWTFCTNIFSAVFLSHAITFAATLSCKQHRGCLFAQRSIVWVFKDGIQLHKEQLYRRPLTVLHYIWDVPGLRNAFIFKCSP